MIARIRQLVTIDATVTDPRDYLASMDWWMVLAYAADAVDNDDAGVSVGHRANGLALTNAMTSHPTILVLCSDISTVLLWMPLTRYRPMPDSVNSVHWCRPIPTGLVILFRWIASHFLQSWFWVLLTIIFQFSFSRSVQFWIPNFNSSLQNLWTEDENERRRRINIASSMHTTTTNTFWKITKLSSRKKMGMLDFLNSSQTTDVRVCIFNMRCRKKNNETLKMSNIYMWERKNCAVYMMNN